MGSLLKLRDRLEIELREEILPFWMKAVPDSEYGGFVGLIDSCRKVHSTASKGAILNARILWTFSAAYRIYGDDAYLKMAQRAYDYFVGHFLDREHGGIYWSVTHDGMPDDTKKHTYTQSFAIYALSEYNRATGEKEALDMAVDLFDLLQKVARDEENGGYLEAFSRDWTPLTDVRLSEGDALVEKSFNTHLHVLESFTNLLRVWPDSELVHELAALIDLHLEHIYDEKTGHFHPFFNAKWEVQESPYSFGHDIEAAWLLLDAARVLKGQALFLLNGSGSNGSDSSRNSDTLIDRLETLLIHVTEVTREEGVDPHSKGIQYLGQKGQVVDSDKHWWVQAEAMVGFLYASQLSGDASFGETASEIMDFVLKDLKIPEVGEWYFRVDENGKPYLEEHIVSQWKCPYHNSRAAFEYVERLAVPQNGLPNGPQNGLSQNGDSESLYEKNPSHDSSI